MVKMKPAAPPNFVDLRPSKRSSKSRLIQDIIYPVKSTKWRAFVNLNRIIEVLIVVLIIFGIMQLTKPGNPLPKDLRKQVSFTTYLPTKLP